MLKLPRFDLLTLLLLITTCCLTFGVAVTNHFFLWLLVVMLVALMSARLSKSRNLSPIILGFIGGYLAFAILATVAISIEVLTDEDEEYELLMLGPIAGISLGPLFGGIPGTIIGACVLLFREIKGAAKRGPPAGESESSSETI